MKRFEDTLEYVDWSVFLRKWHLGPDEDTHVDKPPFPGAERCGWCRRWKKPLFHSAKIQWCPNCEK
jgi:hypothetical protein